MLTMRTAIPRALLGLLLLASWAGPAFEPGEARAAEIVQSTRLGAEVTGVLAAGDVHVWQLPLSAGAVVRARLATKDVSEDAGGSSDTESGKGDGSVKPELAILGPDGTTILGGPIAADSNSLLVNAATAGSYRVEVRALAYTGGYELKLEDRTPDSRPSQSSGQVTVAGAPIVVHLDVAAPSSVAIELRRVSGGSPIVTSIQDVNGLSLDVNVRDARSKRLRLQPVPVGLGGGLDVTVDATGGSGVFELRTSVENEIDRHRGGDEREARRIVVTLRPGADAAAVAARNDATLVSFDSGIAVFETQDGHEGQEDDDSDSLALDPDVLLAEPEALANLPEGSQSNEVVVGSDLGRTDVETQPALQRVRATQAQAISTGQGVVVAVLDGGIDATHTFLSGRVLAGFDFVDGDADPAEPVLTTGAGYGHGTFVASTVLATAPGARILPVRVLGPDGKGRVSDISRGIHWAVEHGANVINISFGTQGGSSTIAAEVRAALGSGVCVVAATGNAGNPTVVDFPADLTGVVAVTSVDAGGLRAAFANTGPRTTIAAPGVDIVGAYPAGRWARWSGTSFSAAFVTGGIALLDQVQPGATPAQAAVLLRRSARPPAGRAQRRLLGAGVLDLLRLVR